MWRDTLARTFADWLSDRGLAETNAENGVLTPAQPVSGAASPEDLARLLELIRAPASVNLDPDTALAAIVAAEREDKPNWTAPSTFATWNADAARAIASPPVLDVVRLMAPLPPGSPFAQEPPGPSADVVSPVAPKPAANAIITPAPKVADIAPVAPVRAFNRFTASGDIATNTLFSMQWHLGGGGQPESTAGDASVPPLWQMGFTGKDVHISA